MILVTEQRPDAFQDLGGVVRDAHFETHAVLFGAGANTKKHALFREALHCIVRTRSISGDDPGLTAMTSAVARYVALAKRSVAFTLMLME